MAHTQKDYAVITSPVPTFIPPVDIEAFAHPSSAVARPTLEPALASPCYAPTAFCDTSEDCGLQVGFRESHYNVVLVRNHTPLEVWSSPV